MEPGPGHVRAQRVSFQVSKWPVKPSSKRMEVAGVFNCSLPQIVQEAQARESLECPLVPPPQNGTLLKSQEISTDLEVVLLFGGPQPKDSQIWAEVGRAGDMDVMSTESE